MDNVPSSDYVFEAEYELMSVREVEAYITQNKHLPDVPSAEEFKQNGYKAGDMDDLLHQLCFKMIDKEILELQWLIPILQQNKHKERSGSMRHFDV